MDIIQGFPEGTLKQKGRKERNKWGGVLGVAEKDRRERTKREGQRVMKMGVHGKQVENKREN